MSEWKHVISEIEFSADPLLENIGPRLTQRLCVLLVHKASYRNVMGVKCGQQFPIGKLSCRRCYGGVRQQRARRRHKEDRQP